MRDVTLLAVVLLAVAVTIASASAGEAAQPGRGGVLAAEYATNAPHPIAGGPTGAPPSPLASFGEVAAPAPPTSYPLPRKATVVRSAAQLAGVLRGARTRNIILADGTYDWPTSFTLANGSHLYAQHLGGAVLNAGIVVGGNYGKGGASLRGLAFDVDDPAKTFQSSEVNVWGAAGRNTRVLDCTFEGHWAIGAGLLAMNPAGLVAQRLRFAHFTDEGIRASDNQHVDYGAPTPRISSITDISVNGVSYAQPGASNGTAEAGLFIGEPVTNGVHRIRVRDVAISGIETVNNAWDTLFTDLDIDMSGPHAAIGVGIYLEHDSLHLTFDGFVIKGASTGFNGEWNYGVAGNAAARYNLIEDGTIDAGGWSRDTGHTVGVYLDEGSDSNTVTGVTFLNQNWAAIGAYLNIGTNSFTNNTYALAPGAVEISSDHV